MTRREVCPACDNRRETTVTVEHVRPIFYGHVWKWSCAKGHVTVTWERGGL